MINKLFKSSDYDSFQKELLKSNIDNSKIQKLIDNGIDINQVDEKGRTILFSLIAKRKIDAIKILLENNIDLSIEDEYGRNALAEAVFRGDGMMIRFLLDNGCNVNDKNSSNRTILQDVALEGDYKTFRVLMNYNPEYNLKDNYNKTVLYDAVEGGNVNIVKEVINNIDDINLLDENEQTVLFPAVLKEDTEIAKTLILNGIDINKKDIYGQTILFNAILQGENSIDLILLLVKKGVNLNTVDKNNRTILDEILYVLELQKLKSTELDGKYITIKGDKNYLNLASLLIKNGLLVDRFDDEGNTTLWKEIQKQNYENIEFLLKSGANINTKDEKGQTIFFKEVLKGYPNFKMISYLVKHGVDVNIKDHEEKTAFDYLIEKIYRTENLIQNEEAEPKGYLILFKKLLPLKPKLDDIRSDGRNVLFDVVKYNHFELIKTLLNYGMNPNIKDKEGNTPLSVMIDAGVKIKIKESRERFLERLVFFLKFRVNLEAQDKDGRTVYHKAVIADDLELVEKLLTKKVDLDIKDKQGRTALHHTQWTGNYKIARWLIAAGANMNEPDNAGFTLLNYAAIFGHAKLVIALVASGVLMYNRNPKSKKVAQFFKDKEKNLLKLLKSNISDDKMRHSLREVAENLIKEVNEVLEG